MNRHLCSALAVLILSGATPLIAHEGHDHKDTKAPAPVRSAAPRAEASTPDFELTAVSEGGRLVVYLDRFTTNEPIANAVIEIEGSGKMQRLAEEPAGVYAITASWLAQAGRHPLVFAVRAAGTADLLTTNLDIAAPAAAQQDKSRGEKAPMPAAVSAPARLADGSVFVPKPSQRQLGIRTQVAERSALSRTVELAGRVVPDPNAGGRVQASQSGRIEPGPNGLPLLGRSVARGEVLAYVRPAISSMDRAARNSALAELEGKKRHAEQQLERYRQLEGSVAQRRIDEVRLELESLANSRAALAAGLEQREALVAPVRGILSASHVVAGQMVDSKDVLFELVDPKRLMVEALGYNTALANKASQASATIGDAKIALEFAGAGWQLREQAVPLLFRVRQPAPPLAVGQTLKVLLATREQIEAVRVPAAAVTNGAEPTLWIHRGAERFVPRKVKVAPLDATTIAVISGLEKGERVVTQGAAGLAQVR